MSVTLLILQIDPMIKTRGTKLRCRERDRSTDLKSMTSVPTRLATLVLANATEMRRTALAVARLNRTRTRRNFQNVATSGTSPTSLYTIAPKTRGGTTRRGMMSNRT